jgi:hypothetical protein
MRHAYRFVALSTVLLIAAWAGWMWSGSQAHASDNSSTQGPTHSGRHLHTLLLSAPLAASLPTDNPIFGVKPGGAPWQMAPGNVQLRQNGTLSADVDRLVLTTTGMNPIPDLAASVYCNGILVATTVPVPFSSRGNARIHAAVTLPTFCPAPAVLLNPATGTAATDVLKIYIGFDGMG